MSSLGQEARHGGGLLQTFLQPMLEKLPDSAVSWQMFTFLQGVRKKVRMLVLTRKVSEAICVGEDIRIVIIDIRGGKVRLGIAAPKEVVVDREEIHGKRGKCEKPLYEMADPAIYQPVS